VPSKTALDAITVAFAKELATTRVALLGQLSG